MTADGLAFQSPIPGRNLALGMAHFDEVARGGRSFDGCRGDAQGVAAGRHFFRGHDDATGAVRDLQVGAPVAMWQGGVVLVIGEVGAVSLGITGGGFLGVGETEVPRIRSAFELLGVGVAPLRVIDLGLSFADLGNLRLVLRRVDDCVDALLPLGRTGLRVLDVGNFGIVRRIDGFLRLNASQLGRGSVRNRAFQLDPIHPDRGRGAVTILRFVFGEFSSDGLPAI